MRKGALDSLSLFVSPVLVCCLSLLSQPVVFTRYVFPLKHGGQIQIHVGFEEVSQSFRLVPVRPAWGGTPRRVGMRAARDVGWGEISQLSDFPRPPDPPLTTQSTNKIYGLQNRPPSWLVFLPFINYYLSVAR